MAWSACLILPPPGVKSGMLIPCARKHWAASRRARATWGVLVGTVGTPPAVLVAVDFEPLDPHAARTSASDTTITADRIMRPGC